MNDLEYTCETKGECDYYLDNDYLSRSSRIDNVQIKSILETMESAAKNLKPSLLFSQHMLQRIITSFVDNSDYIDFKANSVADADCSLNELSTHEEATCTLTDRFVESFIEEQLHFGDELIIQTIKNLDIRDSLSFDDPERNALYSLLLFMRDHPKNDLLTELSNIITRQCNTLLLHDVPILDSSPACILRCYSLSPGCSCQQRDDSTFTLTTSHRSGFFLLSSFSLDPEGLSFTLSAASNVTGSVGFIHDLNRVNDDYEVTAKFHLESKQHLRVQYNLQESEIQLITEKGEIQSFPIHGEQRHDNLFVLFVKPNSHLTCAYTPKCSFSNAHLLPQCDTCIHMLRDIITIPLTNTDHDWSIHCIFRLWSYPETETPLISCDQWTLLLSSSSLTIHQAGTDLLSLPLVAPEGTWLNLTLTSFSDRIELLVIDNESSNQTQKNTHLSSSASITLGSMSLTMDLLAFDYFIHQSLHSQLLFPPLNSVSNGQYIKCKEQHTTSQDQLTSSHDPFIIVVHEDSLVTLNPQNCYWLFTNTPFPTSSRLLSHALPSSPVSSCDELLGLCAEKLDKIRRLAEESEQSTNTPGFRSLKDYSQHILLLLGFQPMTMKTLALLDQLLFLHKPSQSLLPQFQTTLVREFNQRHREERSSSEENQLESRSWESKNDDDSSYSRLLQIISTHFDVLFASGSDEVNSLLFLAQKVSSTCPKTETVIYEDLLRSVCENQFLMTTLANRWIPRQEVLRWHRVTPSHESEHFGFDKDLTSDDIVIDEVEQTITNVNIHHRKFNIGIISPAITRGCVECVFRLVEDRVGDEMVCFGVCNLPLDTMNYEESSSMWIYRCYNGELYSQGEKLERVINRAHPGDTITLTLDVTSATLSLAINNKSFGVVFTNLPPHLHLCVLFYNCQPPQREVKLVSILRQPEPPQSISLSSVSVDESTGNIDTALLLIHHLSQCFFTTQDRVYLFTLQTFLDRAINASHLLKQYDGKARDEETTWNELLHPSITSTDLSSPSLPSCLSFHHHTLTFVGTEPTWATAVLSLPQDAATVTLTFTYSSASSPQLILGFIDASTSEECSGFLGSDKNSWGFKSTGQLLHSNHCTGGVLALNAQSPFKIRFDVHSHEMTLILGKQQITIFDSLPETWRPAVSLFTPGDTLHIQYSLEPNETPSMNIDLIEYESEVSEGCVKMAIQSLQELGSLLSSQPVRQSLIHQYCVDYVIPLLSASALAKTTSFSRYAELTQVILQQSKHFQSYADPCLSYLQALLAQLLSFITLKTPSSLPLSILSSGLTLSTLLQQQEEEFQFLNTEQQQYEEEELQLCEELLEATSSRVQALFSLLSSSSHLPSLIQHRPFAIQFTKYALVFLLHHSSTISLVMLFAEYLLHSQVSLPPFLSNVWRRVIMTTCSMNASLLTEDTLHRIRFCCLHLNSYYDALEFVTPTSSSLSIDFDENATYPPSLRQLYLLPRSSTLSSLFTSLVNLTQTTLTPMDLTQSLLDHTHLVLLRLQVWKCFREFSSSFTSSTSDSVVEVFLQQLPLIRSGDKENVYESLSDGLCVCESIQTAIQSEYQQTLTNVFLHLCSSIQIREHVLYLFLEALSIPLNEGQLLFLQQLDFLPSLSSLLTTLLSQTNISQSFLSFLLHFFLLLSHKLTSLSTCSSSSLSFSRSFSTESLPATSLSSSLSVMITQLSTLLFAFLKDLSSKHPSMITPSLVSLLTSTLLVLLPRPVVNPTAWLQLLVSSLKDVDTEAQTSLITTITLLIPQVGEIDLTTKEQTLDILMHSLLHAFVLTPLPSPVIVLQHQCAEINLFRSFLLSSEWSALTQRHFLELLASSSFSSRLAVTSVLGGDLLSLAENGEAVYRRKMGERGEPSERCFVNAMNRGENSATITLDASGETLQVPILALDYTLPVKPQLMSLSHELVQTLFTLLDEPSHSSLIYSLYRASLLKCLAALASQMNTISFSQQEILRRLLDTSLIVSNTPGEMITPFLSSTIIPYVLQQAESTLKTPQDESFSSSLSEDASSVPWQVWEYEQDGEWSLLSLQDCRLLDSCIRGQLGVILVTLFNDERFLLDTHHLTLHNIRSTTCHHIRVSPTFLSLYNPSIPSLLIHKAISLHGSDISASMQFISSSVSPLTPTLPSSSVDQELLPSLTFSDEIVAETESDESLFLPMKRLFNTETAFWSINNQFMQYSWNSTFRRLFLISQVPRDNSDSSLLHQHLLKIEIIYSRLLLVHSLLKSSSLSSLPVESTWKVFKITWLQSETSILWKLLQDLLISAIRETSSHPLVEEVKKDVMTMIPLMKKGMYHESVKCIRGASFNSDVYLACIPQIRVLDGMVEIATILGKQTMTEKEESWVKWCVEFCCALSQSSRKAVQYVALQWLHRLQHIRSLESWIQQQIAPLITDHQLLESLQGELEQYPLLSLLTQARLALADSISIAPSPQSFRYLHFPPHQRLSLGNRPIQPSWTLEFWLRLPVEVRSPEPISLFSGLTASVDVVCGMKRNRIQLLSDNAIVTVDCDIPSGQWSHVAIVMDSMITQCTVLVNGVSYPSVVTSTALVLDSIGSERNTLDFCMGEIRCWTHARTESLIQRDQFCLLNESLLTDHLALYLSSLSDDQIRCSDITNWNLHIDKGGVEVCSWKDCPLKNRSDDSSWKQIQEQRGLMTFSPCPAVGGRWLTEFSVGCHFTLFQSQLQSDEYRAILDLLDDTLVCEMRGKKAQQQICLTTSYIHCQSTCLPDFAENLSIRLNDTSFDFSSSILCSSPSEILPSYLSFHSKYHSPILTASTPTTILNVSEIKQWGMALLTLRPEDANSSSPVGFISGSHTWDVLIKRCTTQYMGIGVASLGTKLNSYLGRDFTGWSFQPTGEKWHSNIGYNYGPPRPSYCEGDVISVELDLDKGTLAFFKNNQYLGIAFTDLLVENPSMENGFFPAVTSYRSGDAIEVLGLREGLITDNYPSNEQGLKSWRASWVKGIRHGFGVKEYVNGEKQHGIWRDGVCEGCMVIVKGSETHVMWYEKGIEKGEATDEQIRSMIPTNLASMPLILSLQSTTMPPLRMSPSRTFTSPITGTGSLSSTSLFTFSSTHCAAGISLSSDHLTATCTSNSRCMVLGSRAFHSGRYYWEVRVNDCDVGSLFIGVAARLPGSSHQCWRDYGFVNNHTVQDHTSERYYGVQYVKGDIIGVFLDMDFGLLAFSKKGSEFYYSHNNVIDLGIACRSIRTAESLVHQSLLLYPSFGFKHAGDSITLLSEHSLESSGLTAESLLSSYRLWKQIEVSLLKQQPSEALEKAIEGRYKHVFEKNRMKVRSKVGIPIELEDVSSCTQIQGRRYDHIWSFDESQQEFWLDEKSPPISSIANPVCSSTQPDWKQVFSLENVIQVHEWIQQFHRPLGSITAASLSQLSPLESISSFSLSTLARIIILLQLADEAAFEAIPLLDTTHFTDSRLKQIISFDTKKRLLQSFLDSSSLTYQRQFDEFERPISIPEFHICRVAAKKSQMAGESLISITHHSVLNQLIDNMETVPIAYLRRQFNHAEDAGQKRCFFVRLVGEGVYDSGGPYREVITTAASEEPFSTLQLTTPCSNWEGGICKEPMWSIRGEEAKRSIERERLCYYWGVLIGIAVRGNIPLSLPLTPLFWKQVVSEQGTVDDLRQSDDGVVNASTHWEEVCEACGGTAAVISALPCSDRMKRSLLRRRGELSQQVWSEYLIECVMNDMKAANESVIRGIMSILPQEVLTLFTPNEMMQVVCGESRLSVESLQAIAEYGEGIDSSTSIIQRFWRVVASFTDTQRAKLLEFVCARTRIPTPPAPPISFKITVIRGGDKMLPQSQTCFSILKLPIYSSDELMKKQLIYAMENTPTMELDVQLHDAEGWSLCVC